LLTRSNRRDKLFRVRQQHEILNEVFQPAIQPRERSPGYCM
jgi:hypothetical protein